MADDVFDRGVTGGQATCRETRAPGKKVFVRFARASRPRNVTLRISLLAIFSGEKPLVPILALNSANE